MTAIKVVWTLCLAEGAALARRAVDQYGASVLAVQPSASAVSVAVVESARSRCDLVSSWWLEVGADGRDPIPGSAEAGRCLAEVFGGLLIHADGWRVAEVVHWDERPPAPPGVVNEGVEMLAFVARRPNLTPEEFESRYRAHAAIARVHHPGIARYVQNFVRSRVNPDAPSIDAIAQLSFASRSDFAERFYRDEASREIVAGDVARFLDRERSWSLLAREHLLRR